MFGVLQTAASSAARHLVCLLAVVGLVVLPIGMMRAMATGQEPKANPRVASSQPDTPKENSTTQPTTGAAGPDAYDISGTVVDATPDYSQIDFDRIATAKSDEELRAAFAGGRGKDRPASGAVVTLRDGSVTRHVVTDSEGKFTFGGLPAYGQYELSAEAPWGTEDKRMATAAARIERLTCPWVANLQLRADRIVVRGRLTDAQGRPVAGAKVRGEPYPVPSVEEIVPPTRFAVSGADGCYELQGFRPAFGIHKVAGYLNGGDPTENGECAFYVEVRVEADYYVQSMARVPRVPLVTEDVLEPARRLLKALSQVEKTLRHDGRYKFLGEKEGLPLPASHGNTITGIDIVLDPRPPSAHVSGRLVDTKGNPRPNRVLALSAVNSGPGVDYVSSTGTVQVTTGENGVFDLPSFAPGHYSVLVYGAPPNGWYMYQIPVKGDVLNVEPGKRVEDVEIRINPPEDFAVSGHVRDARGNPVSGLYVSTSISTGFGWSTSTDDTGAYRIEGLDGTGLSSFKIDLSGPAIHDVPLNSKNVDLIIPDWGSIDGLVRDAKTGEATDNYEVEVPVVRLLESGAVWEKPGVEIERKPGGRFSISSVWAGEATVLVRAPGFGVQRFTTLVQGEQAWTRCGHGPGLGAQRPTTLAAAGRSAPLECALLGPAVLEGRTTLDGKPQSTTIVIADAWLRSNEDGTFRFDQFPNGDYTIWFPGSDYGEGDGWNYRSAEVHLKSGETTRLDMELGGSCEVCGSVTFPKEDASCMVRLASKPAPGGWSDSGRPSPDEFVLAYSNVEHSGEEYRLRAIPPGRYYLMAGRRNRSFMHRYLLATSKVVELKEGETLQLNLDLTEAE